jgi:hypothetical protein
VAKPARRLLPEKPDGPLPLTDLQVTARRASRGAPEQRIGDGLRRQKRCKPPQPYIGIDYSGAETPRSGLPGLRVYTARGRLPIEVLPPPSLRKH